MENPLQEDEYVYSVTRKVAADRSRGRCEAHIKGVCLGVATEVHHRRMRSAGNADGMLHHPKNLLATCRGCHNWAHHNPAQAYEVGMLLHPWDIIE